MLVQYDRILQRIEKSCSSTVELGAFDASSAILLFGVSKICQMSAGASAATAAAVAAAAAGDRQ